ncbi:hypothetical protein C1878_00515 [Gordonibacter sp. 28C]|uniref:efflux RND transporter periplasmic adaptor subunit n=1 Tax=Gordonibacter sp. 28C TaxID=2078569 RepID=UPI000DF7CC79|nr:HlyD family efflux transporter periplasmic adaptor subunit [Gordonibacter sp. 28C]RDB64379.1 hypothetical protein C1878_00515 [Gordonibacter sp. 28C]
MTNSSVQQRKKPSVGLVVLAFALALALGGAAWWLVAGDEAFGGVLKGLGGSDPAEEAPLPTAPVTRETVEKAVTGAGEVKGSATEKLKPAKWRYFSSFDAPLNKLVRAGEPLVSYTYGDPLVAPYDLVVKSYTMPKAKEELSQDEHFVEVERMDTVHIEMPVSESDLASLAEGQEVDVAIGDQAPRAGVISNINQVGAYNASGSKFTVTVDVVNDGSIWLGMSATLSVKVAMAENVLAVPVSAVSGADDAKTVTVQDADGTTRTVPVTTGISDGALVEVSGELNEGDLVVLNEVPSAFDGEAGVITTMVSEASV